MQEKELEFEVTLGIIGINPYVFVPDEILKRIFSQSGRDKSPIPIKGEVNGKSYRQTLVKFKGAWRLYINTEMLENSPARVGEFIYVTIAHDPTDRTVKPHPKLLEALDMNSTAKNVFDNLPKSRQQEIVKYISFLKTEASIEKNVKKAIDFLNGRGRFIGRDKP